MSLEDRLVGRRCRALPFWGMPQAHRVPISSARLARGLAATANQPPQWTATPTTDPSVPTGHALAGA